MNTSTGRVDRFPIFRLLLESLENVKQDPRYHPEGDALYHSLQVFDLASQERPYDEEFLLAALLHDVGKAVDPREHVRASLDLLGNLITDRTRWLIEHHMLGHAMQAGSLGARGVRRLRESEHFEDLRLLVECDQAGRVAGVTVSELDEALDYVRQLDDADE